MTSAESLLDLPEWADVGRLIGQKITRIKLLEGQIASMHDQLAATRKERIPCSQKDFDDVKRRYKDLHQRHRTLAETNARNEQRCREAEARWAEAKQRIAEWQVYLKRNNYLKDREPSGNETADELPTENADSRSADERSSPFHAAQPDSTPTPLCRGPLGDGLAASTQTRKVSASAKANQAPNSVEPDAELTMTNPTEPLEVAAPASQRLAGHRAQKPSKAEDAADSGPSSRRITSSQTTEDVSTSPAEVKQEHSSGDEPEITGVKLANKKRRASACVMPPPTVIKQEESSAGVSIDIISDGSSSSSQKRRRLNRTETMDLDAQVEQHTATARKFRQDVPAKGVAAAAGDSQAQPKLAEKAEPRSSPERQPQNLSEVEVESPVAEPTSRNKDKKRAGEVLRTLSPNVPSASRSTASEAKSKQKHLSRDLADKIRLVAEGGDEAENSQGDQSKHDPKELNTENRLLDTLLDRPSPKSAVLPKRAIAESTSAKRPSRQTKESGSANLRPEKATPRLPEAHSDTASAHSPARPEHEPLRSRPLRSLRLDDFRINAIYMGEDFAFADTIRGKDQRRCLPGCTRPECCGGAFRKAVEFGAVTSTKSDAELLQDYLGSNWADIIGAYGPEKRKDLLTQARAFAFANVHGKHRAAFERHSTPPGFWRTDMPTTQEELEDREKAREMERGKVEERWREAMRENGRWKFKDE